MNKIRTADKVKIVAGKDKGREGKVKKVLPAKNKLIVDGINKYKKHVKAQGEGKPGGIVEIELPLPISNVVLICPTCKLETRVGIKQEKSGNKHRICKKCQAKI